MANSQYRGDVGVGTCKKCGESSCMHKRPKLSCAENWASALTALNNARRTPADRQVYPVYAMPKPPTCLKLQLRSSPPTAKEVLAHDGLWRVQDATKYYVGELIAHANGTVYTAIDGKVCAWPLTVGPVNWAPATRTGRPALWPVVKGDNRDRF